MRSLTPKVVLSFCEIDVPGFMLQSKPYAFSPVLWRKEKVLHLTRNALPQLKVAMLQMRGILLFGKS